MTRLPPLTILLAEPRGFCAGVDRAIQIVEKALIKYGPPIYVRHEIVHNRHVVSSLEALGAVFVEELHEVPDGGKVIFSAHGVPKAVPDEANRRGLFFLDATCPLVSKVHHEAQHLYEAGHLVLLIGHKGHPEVIGTMGQLPAGAVVLVENLAEVASLHLEPTRALAYVTQTTLSVDETKEIAAALKLKFPHIKEPRKDDICYATTNRQMAVKALAPHVDRMIVIGAQNSSNSVRLMEVAKAYGCGASRLYADASQVDWSWLQGARTLGLSAGASAPEILVEELISACKARYEVTVEGVTLGKENVYFNLPRVLEGV